MGECRRRSIRALRVNMFDRFYNTPISDGGTVERLLCLWRKQRADAQSSDMGAMSELEKAMTRQGLALSAQDGILRWRSRTRNR